MIYSSLYIPTDDCEVQILILGDGDLEEMKTANPLTRLSQDLGGTLKVTKPEKTFLLIAHEVDQGLQEAKSLLEEAPAKIIPFLLRGATKQIDGPKGDVLMTFYNDHVGAHGIIVFEERCFEIMKEGNPIFIPPKKHGGEIDLNTPPRLHLTLSVENPIALAHCRALAMTDKARIIPFLNRQRQAPETRSFPRGKSHQVDDVIIVQMSRIG